MCGIAGFTRFHRDTGDESTLECMGDAMRHRGPDAHGSFLAESIGLHHRRLAIIDLSAAGVQPMHSACGRYVIVFNGEIYNYLELRAQLSDEGYSFQTDTDTEVILAMFARDGIDCLANFNGMFAFAIWDCHEDSLVLARDRIGKKPLYYASVAGELVFASELKALLAAELVERRIRLDAVYDFFAYQYVPDPKSIFEDVYKLEPGHWLRVDASGLEKQQYWDLSFRASDIPEQEAQDRLRSLINDATERRMISDVPLGAFLSGGVDSGGIVATMAGLSEQAVTTCSIGFDEKQFNETEFAQLVADQYETNHHEFLVHENVRDSLLDVIRFFDEPFADSSSVPTFFVSKLAREEVTVALAGDGGDEVFAGYEKYSIDAVENRWRERFPEWSRRYVFPSLSRLLSGMPLRFLRRGGTLLDALAKPPALAFYQSNAQITDLQWNTLASTEVKTKLNGYHPSAITVEAYERCDGDSHLSRILYVDTKTYLPGDILVKVDRMSMANSLEVRAPILDYTLMEFAAGLSPDLKLKGREKKYLLKQVLSQDLPDEILTRRKMGFSPPLADWLRNSLRELAEQTLFDAEDGLLRFFNMRAVQQLWMQHQQQERDHSALLWSLLMFQLWWNEYMEAPCPSS